MSDRSGASLPGELLRRAGLTDMTPSFAPNNVADRGDRNSVLFSEMKQPNFPESVIGQNVSRGCGVKLGVVLPILGFISRPVCPHFSHRETLRSKPALGSGIMGVVLPGAQKQMIWPDTRPIVAFVKDAKTVRNWAIGQHPRDSMCVLRMVPSGVEAPIAVQVGSSQPEPATSVVSANKDALPKPFLN